MAPRKNKSVRFSAEELSGLAEIAERTDLDESVLIQKAVKYFTSHYRKHGAAILDKEFKEEAAAGRTTGSANNPVCAVAGDASGLAKTTRRLAG